MSLRPAIASVASASRMARAQAVRAASSAAASSSQASTSTLPEIHLGQTHPSRYHDHYDATVASDLLYMTYNHRATATAEAQLAAASTEAAATSKPVTGYEANRPKPAPRGNRPIQPLTKGITAESVPKLESITIHTMVKEAIGNKHALLSAIMALRNISGEAANGGGRNGSTGVQVVISRQGAAAFKLRAGMPVSAKVELRGEAMYDFIQSLVDFVLPRIREFPGFTLPVQSASKSNPSALAGVVSMGLPAAAMGLFPQVEGNIDAYPRLHGFHMHFKTNAKGKDAQEHARALLSGFRIPFHKK